MVERRDYSHKVDRNEKSRQQARRRADPQLECGAAVTYKKTAPVKGRKAYCCLAAVAEVLTKHLPN